jgi:imidazolonepropionase
MSEPIPADLVICRLAQTASPAAGPAPLRGEALGRADVREGDVWIAIEGERISGIGPGWEIRPRLQLDEGAQVIDAEGLVAIPGLVDCHSHACFAGDRVGEFELRSRGASYEELHAAGGGILSTVEATRAAELDELTDAVERHVGWMLGHGTTTVEVKSGYGLDVDCEIRMLQAIGAASSFASPRIVPTVLGPHAVPAEADADAWIATCVEELLPKVAEWELATAADVFVEQGAYDVDQARRWLVAAASYGLAQRLHADQFSELGGIELACELGARSVDHLEATGTDGVGRLAASDTTTGVLLPTAALVLGRPMPPARALVDAGAAIALATDFNPGSSYCASLPLVAALACTQLGLSPAEALAAMTVNAAHVLGLDDVGRLEVGASADVVVLDAPDWRYLAYRLGHDGVRHVIARGEWVVGE